VLTFFGARTQLRPSKLDLPAALSGSFFQGRATGEGPLDNLLVYCNAGGSMSRVRAEANRQSP